MRRRSLSVHPLFGAVCLLALVNAASGFVEHDTMSGRVLHDAHRFSGGHINLKPFGQTLMTRWLLGELTPIPRDQFVAGFVAATDPGNEAGEHTGFGVGNTHQTRTSGRCSSARGAAACAWSWWTCTTRAPRT